jgi:FimV-like protein
MLRTLRLTLLTLFLAVPGISLALGLGDIRVDSALHQPFVAQIELVGATAEELGGSSAAIASEETFERYGLERAPFIYGTTLVVGQDAGGRSVINLRSTEKFTEPVVNLLVDLHTPKGELIREYTVLLDPPDLLSKPGGSNYASATPAAAAAAFSGTPPAVASSAMPPARSNMSAPPALSSTPAAESSRASASTTRVADTSRATAAKPTPTDASVATPDAVAKREASAATPDIQTSDHTYRVARRDTLERIASKAGARSGPDRHRMMIAIFRDNPAAFQGNFNKLHSGATLEIPTAAQLSAISVDDTTREYDEQMTSWRAQGRRLTALAGQTSVANVSGTPASDSQVSTPRVPAPQLSGPQAPAARETGPQTPGAQESAARVPFGSSAKSDDSRTADRMPASAASTTDPGATSGADETNSVLLTQRVASLEKSLDQLEQELQKPLPVRAAAPITAAMDSAAADEEEDEEPVDGAHHGLMLGSLGVGIVLVLVAGAWLYRRHRNSYGGYSPDLTGYDEENARRAAAEAPGTAVSATTNRSTAPTERTNTEPKPENTRSPGDAASWFEESFSTPIADLLASNPTMGLALGPEVESSAQTTMATSPVMMAFAPAAAASSPAAMAAMPTVAPTSPPTTPVWDSAATAPALGLAATPLATAPARGSAVTSSAGTAFSPTIVAASPTAKVNTAAVTPRSAVTRDAVTSSLSLAADSPVAAPSTAAARGAGAERAVVKPARRTDSGIDTTAVLAPDFSLAETGKFSFFNPQSSTNTTHVVMEGNSISEAKPFVERRKNPADVLRQAIDREPQRSDLRLELLELYYTAAAENRRAFLDATRQLSKDQQLATPEDWARINDMGRTIAPEDELFAGKLGDMRVA